MFEPTEVTAVTLRIINNVNEPIIRDFMVYYVAGDNSFLYEDPRKEVSLDAKATASDEHSAPYVASKICDGNTGTWWGVSEQVKAPYNCWVELDLGKDFTINETAINEPWHRTEQFRLEYRSTEDEDWNVAFEDTKMGSNYKRQFEAVTARYWRLRIQEANHDPAIVEWKLFSPHQSNPWVKCGSVGPGTFKQGRAQIELDISKCIDQPGQFLLRFDDIGTSAATVEHIEVFYDGHPVHEEVLSAVKEGQVYLLNRHAQIVEESKIVLHVMLKTHNSSDAKMEVAIKKEI
jgi:hypothetical protein